MANPKTLVPQAHKLTVDDQSKGGKKSAQARKAKKTREERIEYIFNLAVKNPKILKNLEAMGIDATEMDNETAMDCRMVLEALKGNVNAWNSLKNERYGMKTQKVENTNIELKPILPKRKNGVRGNKRAGKDSSTE